MIGTRPLPHFVNMVEYVLYLWKKSEYASTMRIVLLTHNAEISVISHTLYRSSRRLVYFVIGGFNSKIQAGGR
jgi:hypothetical protein